MKIYSDRSDFALIWINRILVLGIIALLIGFFIKVYAHTQLEVLLKGASTRDDIFRLNPLGISKIVFVEHTSIGTLSSTDRYVLSPFHHVKIAERFYPACGSSRHSFADCPDDLKSSHHIQVSTRYLKRGWVYFLDESEKIIRVRSVEFW